MSSFDDLGNLDPDLLPPGIAGRLLAELCRKERAYTKSQITRLWDEHRRVVYRTPLGNLYHREDVLEVARRIGWHRHEPVTGYLGGNPWCAGSGESIPQRQIHPMPVSVTCPECRWVFDAQWSASYDSQGNVAGYTCKIPVHKQRREKEPQ